MSLKSWLARKVAAREVEKMIRSLEKSEGGGMKVSPVVQIVVAGVVTAAAIGGLDAAVSYIQAHGAEGTFVWAEFGRTVLVAALGGVLLWLRSPKDKTPTQQ